MKEGYLALLGSKAEAALRGYFVDKAIVSCKAFDMDRGIMDSNDLFAQAKQTMMNSAKESILAVDHSKFDNMSFSKVTDIHNLTAVVTDQKPSEQWLEFLETHKIKCYYPE